MVHAVRDYEEKNGRNTLRMPRSCRERGVFDSLEC